MNYKDYQNARDVAWKILINEDVRVLPVRISDLSRSMGVRVKYYCGEADSDVRTEFTSAGPVIFVSKNKPPTRQRFTAAHELGHIILGHVGYDCVLVNREPSNNDSPIEHEANVFAARLLAPACVLWGCGIRSAEEIAQLCDISLLSAEFKWKRMQILYERNRFLTSPLERKVFAQFTDYIATHKL